MTSWYVSPSSPWWLASRRGTVALVILSTWPTGTVESVPLGDARSYSILSLPHFRPRRSDPGDRIEKRDLWEVVAICGLPRRRSERCWSASV